MKPSGNLLNALSESDVSSGIRSAATSSPSSTSLGPPRPHPRGIGHCFPHFLVASSALLYKYVSVKTAVAIEGLFCQRKQKKVPRRRRTLRLDNSSLARDLGLDIWLENFKLMVYRFSDESMREGSIVLVVDSEEQKEDVEDEVSKLEEDYRRFFVVELDS